MIRRGFNRAMVGTITGTVAELVEVTVGTERGLLYSTDELMPLMENI